MDDGSPSPLSNWLVKMMNSPLFGEGADSVAGGTLNHPFSSNPATRKDFRIASVHLDAHQSLAAMMQNIGVGRLDVEGLSSKGRKL